MFMMPCIVHKKDSHKGQNGKVLIISGSKDYYGATVLTALSCLKSGVDLVYIYTPEINRQIVASYSPEFIIKTYSSDYFNIGAVNKISSFLDSVDCVLIGPGLSRDDEILFSTKKILEYIKTPIILDADSLYALDKNITLPTNSVVTPHMNEFRFICDSLDTEDIVKISKMLNCTVVKKGRIDIIVQGENYYENETGNESLTKGGTGDILAGLISGFIAQGEKGFDASKRATYELGLASIRLFKEKRYNFLASELINNLFNLES